MKDVNYTTITDYLEEVQEKLTNKYGRLEAGRMISPLNWYISTGRASTDFLKALINAAPATTAAVRRRLERLDSYDDTISAVCKALRYNPT